MLATVVILLLWIGFAGSHMALSSLALRKQLVARTGESAFLGLYTLVSFVFFIPLVWTYFANKHAGPWLWVLPYGLVLQWIIYIGMGVAFVLLVAGLARPSPASVRPGPTTPQGVQRITRHPVVMSTAIFGLLHILVNSSSADVVFFGGFVVFALIGARHQDQRKLAMNVPGFSHFYEGTPFLPFTGSETVQGIRELSPLVVAVGIGLTIVVRYFHPSWFGG